jgi:hypothetical protein
MWGFPWMFWLVPFLLFLMVSRHWRRERWASRRMRATVSKGSFEATRSRESKARSGAPARAWATAM